jgi:ribonuclease E
MTDHAETAAKEHPATTAPGSQLDPEHNSAGAGGSDGVASATTPTSAARRRRRRGGRGRGGGGQRPVAGTTEPREDEGDVPPRPSGAEEEPAAATAPKPRAPRPPRPARQRSAAPAETAPGKTEPDADRTAEGSTGEGTLEAGQDATATGAPKRRRRGHRGGRGRKRPSGSTGSAVREATEAGEDESLPVDSTEETQRDDAAPDEGTAAPVGASPSRRRRGRGQSAASRAPKPAAGPKAPGEAKPRDAKPESKPEAQPRPGGRTSPRTAEEIVAAGGPTRGIRSSRTRTGRDGRDGRRRRELLPVVPRITDKLMVITEHGERDQIAVLEGRDLVQHYVTRVGAQSMVGNVYLGRVQNVLPGMEAAFIDIGRGRNGVLYAGEVNFSPEDLDRGSRMPRIEQVLKSGQAVMVQVTKDPMGGKGARLTAQISMPGRYIVMVPDADVSGISRRLPDNERRRLKTIMKKVKPERHGVIVRTAAEGASEEALTADLKRLLGEWDEIQRKAKRTKAPAVLYEEPELTVRVVRDLFNDEEFRGLVTDSTRVHEKVMEYVNAIAPDLAPKITLHQGRLPAFEEHHIEEQIHKALDRKVWLPSGGYLIIERTEAMTIVDVNTGKSVGKTNLEETVVNTNLEAAAETARQLRLRDIGGIIVIDFIDMLLEQNKRKVEDTMREALALDKTRSQVFEIGPLGLMQVTRKRVSGGLVESFSEVCPTCEGRGILINYEV